MGIQFKINVRRKILINGKEYGGVEEMPEDLRQAYERGVAAAASGAAGRGSVTTKLVVNGQEYAGVGDMPPGVPGDSCFHVRDRYGILALGQRGGFIAESLG